MLAPFSELPMSRLKTYLVAFTIVAGFLAARPSGALADEAGSRFPLKDGDTWVMAGDSITAQHLHSNYFEAFCFARYPSLTFRFRNSGVGGDTIPKVLARFDWDVGVWKPTVVSVELGMNDQGGYSVEKYIANMGTLHDRIKAAGARPVYFTASPINSGDTMARPGNNTRLHQYAVALKEFAEKSNAPFADQFHMLIDVWGKNKPRELLANALPGLKQAAKDESLAGVEHLRSFLAAQEKSHRPLVSMKGDPVHPGAPGQLMMAAALLKQLGASCFVSSVVLDAGSKNVVAKGCAVDGVEVGNGKLVFNRLDECLPIPIPDDARAVLPLFPTILELSQYILQVKGLPGGTYALKVNGKPTATLSEKELADGVNLTAFAQGPIADQGKAILAEVAAKEGLVGQYRGLSRQSAAAPNARLKEMMDALAERIDAADAKIRAAAKPKKLRFELTRVIKNEG
jgi:lysophospholipase L1-like esterase